MVQFGFLSNYDLFALYMYFKKGMQTDTTKKKAWQKHYLWINNLAVAAILDFFSKCCSVVSPLLGDVEKPQKLWQLQNLDTEAAEILKSVWFGTILSEIM